MQYASSADETGGGARPETAPALVLNRLAAASIELVVSEAPRRAELTTTVLRQSLTRAADAWNQRVEHCKAPELRVLPQDTGAARVARDGVSRVVVRERWCPDGARDFDECHDRDRAAITHVYPEKVFSDGTALVAEADIEINAEHFRWSPAGGGAERPLDATLAHELGHVLGLGHPCAEPHEARKGKILCTEAAAKGLLMYPDPGEPGRDVVVAPHASEVEAVCAAYAPEPASSWTTGKLGASSALIAALGLAIFFELQRRRSRGAR